MQSSPNVTLAITGMSCGHCVAAVKDALGDIAGITSAQVAIGSATLAIDPGAGSPNAIVEAAVEAIRDSGYDADVAPAPTIPTSSCCGAKQA